MRLLTGLGLGTFLALAGCGKDSLPDTFRTSVSQGVETHLGQATTRAVYFGCPLKKSGYDKDVDRDGMDDFYVVCREGTSYYTRSSRLLTGKDDGQNLTWFKGTESTIDEAPAGEYFPFGGKKK